jgi:hypothetical protein
MTDLRFHLSWLLISSFVFSCSGGTETELADLGLPVACGAREFHERRPDSGILACSSSVGDRSGAVHFDVFYAQSRFVAIAAERVQDLVDRVVDLLRADPL